MKPYYDEDGITIYNARCEDVLPVLSDVGLILTSPPYNLSGEGKTGGHDLFSKLDDGYGAHDDAMPHVEYVAWQHEVIRLCWATLANDGAIFYNHKPIVRGNEVRTPLELVPGEVPVRQIIVWDRLSGFCRNRTHFVPAHEWVLMLARPEFRLTTRSVDDVWRIPFETGNEHPAPFPLSFARRAVEATAAQVVVDPFAGSGTALRAAKDAGRRAIGIELDERYCEIAAARLAQGALDFGGAA